MITTIEIISYLMVFAAGAVTAIGVLGLLRHPEPQDDLVEGIDGLDRAFDSASSDLPTQPLPEHRPGAIYASRHRRKGSGKRLASLGRTHPQRVQRSGHDLP